MTTAPPRHWIASRIGQELPAVMVAIPAVNWVWTPAVIALLALRLPPGSEIVYTQGGTSLLEKRTKIAEAFLAHEQFGALLLLDSDMVPPPDMVERLLRHRLPIVGALYFNRVPPFVPCVIGSDGNRLRLTDLNGTVLSVNGVGTGAMLVRREALLQVPRPWFDWLEPGEGDDVYFCRAAREAGVPVYCDTSLVAGHVGATSVNRAFAATWQRAERIRQMTGT